jgi:MoaA/NifB/PqqE/SkfB family radical SAM enzyme
VDHCGVGVVDIPSNFAYAERMVAALEPLATDNPDVVFDIQLSLDHIGEAHDDSRVVPGLYEKAKASFRALAAVRAARPNLKLKISVVYLDRNRDDLPAIAEGIRRDFDCDRVQLAYANRVLPPGGDPAEAVEVAAFQEAARAWDQALPPRDLFDLHTVGMKSVKGLYGELLADAAHGRRATGEICDAGRIIAVVDEKGDVFGCEPLWESLGNVREADYDVGAILAGPEARAWRAKRLGPGRCNCSWGCAIHSHISTTPRHLPRLGLEAGRIAGRIAARRLLSGL